MCFSLVRRFFRPGDRGWIEQHRRGYLPRGVRRRFGRGRLPVSCELINRSTTAGATSPSWDCRRRLRICSSSPRTSRSRTLAASATWPTLPAWAAWASSAWASDSRSALQTGQCVKRYVKCRQGRNSLRLIYMTARGVRGVTRRSAEPLAEQEGHFRPRRAVATTGLIRARRAGGSRSPAVCRTRSANRSVESGPSAHGSRHSG